jgi:hypothetical protein
VALSRTRFGLIAYYRCRSISAALRRQSRSVRQPLLPSINHYMRAGIIGMVVGDVVPTPA